MVFLYGDLNEVNISYFYSNILLPFQGECSDHNNEYDEEFDELPGGLVSCYLKSFIQILCKSFS